MKRRAVLTSLAATAAALSLPVVAKGLPPLQVFRHPSCGCCGAWVEHMLAAGFSVTVTVTEVDDTSAAMSWQAMCLPTM